MKSLLKLFVEWVDQEKEAYIYSYDYLKNRSKQHRERVMRMIIGGVCQGKLDYGKRLYPDISWVDGNECGFDELKRCKGIYNFHLYIRRMLQAHNEMVLSETMTRLPGINPDIIIISEEIGYGIVPVDSFERRFREQVGRICTELAAHSDRVDRVICGIGMMIKAPL